MWRMSVFFPKPFAPPSLFSLVTRIACLLHHCSACVCSILSGRRGTQPGAPPRPAHTAASWSRNSLRSGVSQDSLGWMLILHISITVHLSLQQIMSRGNWYNNSCFGTLTMDVPPETRNRHV